MDNLITTKEIAERFNVSLRRAQAIAKNRHEKYGIGQRIGNMLVFEEKDLDKLQPGCIITQDVLQ